jgi:hypothetical protein
MYRRKPEARLIDDSPPAPAAAPRRARRKRRRLSIRDLATLPRWAILLLAIAAFLAGFAIVLAILHFAR